MEEKVWADPSSFDFGVAIFAGAAAVYTAFGKKDWVTAFLAACICILSICKAILTIRRNLNQKSIHELEGCLNTLHAMIQKEGGRLWMTLHVPIDEGQRLEQVMDYVSDDESIRSGAGRRFSAQSGVIGVALREKDPAISVRQNTDHQAYINELVHEWSYTQADAKKTNPATMSAYAVPMKNHLDEVECVLYCGSTDREFFQGEIIELINKACIGIARFIRNRYSP